MRSIPPQAVDFITKAEGVRLTAYRDSIGVPTIGVGSTKGVVIPMTITAAEARERLEVDLEVAAARIENNVSDAIIAAMSDNQYSALLSFVFNVGANPKWTIWKALRARQFDKVPAELRKFVYAGGRPLPGLVKRRAAEAALWASSLPAKPPLPVIGLAAPVTAVVAPAVILAAKTHSPILPVVLGIALTLALAWVVITLIRTHRNKPMPTSDAFNTAVANLVAAFNAKVAAAGDTTAKDAEIADLQAQLATAQGAAAQVDADDTAAVVAATPTEA